MNSRGEERRAGTGGSLAIIGLGLIGGSVARRALKRGWRVGWVDPEADEEAVRAFSSDLRSIDPERAREFDLVLLATPTDVAIDLLRKLDFGEAAVTSVCSVMSPLTTLARERGIRFVAGHPMAGREVKGWEHSIAELFEDRFWFRSEAGPPGEEQAVALVDRLIIGLGAKSIPIDSDDHDRYAALASHLPQLLSTALAAVIEESDLPEPFRGPGLRTFLRLAGSSWSMWEPVLEYNADAIAAARERLETMLERIEQGKGGDVFEQANAIYDALSKPI